MPMANLCRVAVRKSVHFHTKRIQTMRKVILYSEVFSTNETNNKMLLGMDQFTPVNLFTPTLSFLKDLYFFIEHRFTTSQIIIKSIIYIGDLLCNTNYLQLIYSRGGRQKVHGRKLVDHQYCFTRREKVYCSNMKNSP